MFAVKTVHTPSTELVISIPDHIGIGTLPSGSAISIAPIVLGELYSGKEVVITVVIGDERASVVPTSAALIKLIEDRAKEFIEILQDAFASASFDLLLSTRTVNNHDFEWSGASQIALYNNIVDAPVFTLIDVVRDKLTALDNKYYPLIVTEICQPAVPPAIKKVALKASESKKTTKK